MNKHDKDTTNNVVDRIGSLLTAADLVLAEAERIVESADIDIDHPAAKELAVRAADLEDRCRRLGRRCDGEPAALHMNLCSEKTTSDGEPMDLSRAGL